MCIARSCLGHLVIESSVLPKVTEKQLTFKWKVDLNQTRPNQTKQTETIKGMSMVTEMLAVFMCKRLVCKVVAIFIKKYLYLNRPRLKFI